MPDIKRLLTRLILLTTLLFNQPAYSLAAHLTTTGQDARNVRNEQPQALSLLQPELANAALTYTITDLGPWLPYAINNRRQIVGGFSGSGVLWQDGQLFSTGNLNGLPVSFRDINENNQVVGFTTGYDNTTGNSLINAFRWTDANTDLQIEAGEIEWMGNFGGLKTQPHAINNSGQVVGTSWNIAGDERAFLWDGVGMTDLGGSFAQAHDINDNGVVVGEACLISSTVACDDESDPHKAVYWAGGGPIALIQAGNAYRASEINNRGEIIGQYEQFDGYPTRTFLWLPSENYGLAAGIHNLGFYLYAPPHGGINNLGQVVGNQNFVNVQNSFLWQNGVATDLNNLLPPNSGWMINHPTSINDYGDIVGMGYFNGQQRGFLLFPPPRWTLLFYLDGDNNLNSSYHPIFQHLEAMANLPGVRILALWDTLGSSGSWYYEVQYNADLSQYANYEEGVNLWSQGELNMGAPFTLSDFIQWGVGRSPSEHYALILDDHGSGLGGLAWDDTDSHDFITLAELKLALNTAKDQTGEKIDVLYTAMCLMGMLEDAYQVRGLADFYVASEDIQTTYSQYLKGFDSLMNPEQAARLLAENYANQIAAPPPDLARAYTISAADLTRLDPLVTATNALGQALAARMGDISGTLTTVATLVQRYDNEAPEGITQADTYVDLYDFADLLAQNLGSEANIVSRAEAVKQAIENYIIYEAHASIPTKNVDKSYGVSIFFPATAK